MKLLYDIFFIIFSIFYIPGLLIKGKLHKDFLQKFGKLPDDVTRLKDPVWIHAVSVGEAAVAAKLAEAIKKRSKDVAVVVSTTTQTGNNMIRKAGEGSVDAVFYYPFDISVIVAKVVKLINPSLYIMIETELWPNLLEELHTQGVPVVLANGRISDPSFSNYKKVKFIVRKVLRYISCFCMQSERDADRIKQLGALKKNVVVTKNMKFDEKMGGEDSNDKGYSGKSLGFGPEDEMFIAGSTHFPEESVVIDVYKTLKKERDNLKLILAPRHIERIEGIKAYIEKLGLRYRCFSYGFDGSYGKDDILLIDTIGHLKNIYNAASIVFVGGSLARKGGQNPIEAARWGKPVIFGPHMFNFREVADVFLSNKAAICVKDKAELEKKVRDLLADSVEKELLAVNAGQVIVKNAGAVDKTVDIILGYKC